MSLREMVTGNDACTPEGGAGPSNAFSGLANNLLGNSSKAQERLKEIPGFHGLPGTSEARFMPQRPEDAALAAAEGEAMQMPGMRARVDRDGMEQFFPSSRQGGASSSGWHQEFEEMQGRTRRGPPGMGAAGPSTRFPSQAALAPFLQAFVRSGNVPPQLQALPAPKMDLTIEDECQIRDRSTIMARHLFADAGDQFADEQVHRLLHSLQIDPGALPTQPQQANWDQIFMGGEALPRDGRMVHDVVHQNRMGVATRPAVDRWADQFSNLNLQEGMPHGDQLAAEFLSQPGLESQAWAEEFMQGPGAEWAEEFSQTQAASSRDLGKTAGSSADALEQTRALRDTLAASQDPKFRKSKFLQFVSKMSRGEIVLEDNQAKEVAGAAVGNEWAEEHQAAKREANMEEAWNNYNQADGGRSSWVDEFQTQQHPPNAWADQFAGENGIAESWADDFAGSSQHQATAGPPGEQDYVMAADNPFLSDLDSFAKGKELFRNGLLSEARLALEAEVQRQPGNVEAWRLLGTVHAENDNDQQAIAALNKALAASPGNPEVLLSLGVSYTNELDQRRAITYLMEWLKLHPGQAGAASVQLPPNARETLRVAVDIFRTAAQMNASSADAHVALGVLYNLSRDYDGAVAAFRVALQTRSSDYSLWNKLGATLANSGRSSEAIDAYRKALELKPNYMRAWVNMGISQANIGEYETSIRYYGRALMLNSQAAAVWGYLRTSVSCAGRDELLTAVDDEDLDTITTALPL